MPEHHSTGSYFPHCRTPVDTPPLILIEKIEGTSIHGKSIINMQDTNIQGVLMINRQRVVIVSWMLFMFYVLCFCFFLFPEHMGFPLLKSCETLENLTFYSADTFGTSTFLNVGSSGNFCSSSDRSSYTSLQRVRNFSGVSHAYSGSRSQRRSRCRLLPVLMMSGQKRKRRFTYSLLALFAKPFRAWKMARLFTY